jgi:hypothetical protein
VLGILPVWILGIVDYHGSRLVRLERMHLRPTAAQIAAVIEGAIVEHGAPKRLLTDRAPVLRAAEVERVLAEAGTRHVLISPATPGPTAASSACAAPSRRPCSATRGCGVRGDHRVHHGGERG